MAGNENSGGYRQPMNPAPVSPPGALSQRTDGGAMDGMTQPAQSYSGFAYGENKALEDQDPQVQFNAVTSIGNLSTTENIEWNKIESLVTQEQDPGLRQVALLTMAAHHRPNIEEKALPLLQSSDKNLRHAAAIVLISRKRVEAIGVLTEIMNLKYDVAQANELNGSQAESLKVNVLENIEKSKWNAMVNLVEKVEAEDPNIKVRTKAKQVLKVLKN